jgi:hypothetical protein
MMEGWLAQLDCRSRSLWDPLFCYNLQSSSSWVLARIGSDRDRDRINPTAEVAACEIVCFLRFNLRLLGCGFGSDRINFDWWSRSLRDRFFFSVRFSLPFCGLWRGHGISAKWEKILVFCCCVLNFIVFRLGVCIEQITRWANLLLEAET